MATLGEVLENKRIRELEEDLLDAQLLYKEAKKKIDFQHEMIKTLKLVIKDKDVIIQNMITNTPIQAKVEGNG